MLRLCSALAQAGVDVELLVLLWNDGPTIRRRLEEVKRFGVRVVIVRRTKLPVFDSRVGRALVCWGRLTQALGARRDRIVHVHLDLVAVVLAARLAGCTWLVASIHNDEPLYRRWRWRMWSRVIDRWIAGYIGITKHVMQYYMEAAGIDRRKMVVIYYGVDPPSGGRSARREWGIPEQDFVVGFVGRITEQKNLGVLLEALKQVPEVTGILVGEGEDRDALEEKARREGIGNLRFMGAIVEASTIMPSFDVFCLPSKWEGLGLVLVEAMLQGIPIIGSKAGAIPEVLGNGDYGILFDPASTEELVDCLRYAIRHPAEMRSLAEKAREYALRKYSVSRMVVQTIEFYRAVLGTKSGR